MHGFHFARSYRGPVQAVIFDWAGTTVDHGCLAPALVFVEIFQRRGVPLEMAQARAPMGMHKRDHLLAIAAMPSVANAWQRVRGEPLDEGAIDGMYDEFIALQVELIGRHAEPIAGVLEAVAVIRERGVKIGSDTGYNRQMMDVLVPAAAQAGFEPDCVVCSSDVPVGRPAPWMALENARRLNVYPMSAIVKVDDTAPGIEEGLNAGMWTVAVTETGNEVGLSYDDLQALDSQQREARRHAAVNRLARAGAHYVIDGVGQLLPCLKDIERRLARGASP